MRWFRFWDEVWTPSASDPEVLDSDPENHDKSTDSVVCAIFQLGTERLAHTRTLQKRVWTASSTQGRERRVTQYCNSSHMRRRSEYGIVRRPEKKDVNIVKAVLFVRESAWHGMS